MLFVGNVKTTLGCKKIEDNLKCEELKLCLPKWHMLDSYSLHADKAHHILFLKILVRSIYLFR